MNDHVRIEVKQGKYVILIIHEGEPHLYEFLTNARLFAGFRPDGKEWRTRRDDFTTIVKEESDGILPAASL